jgi:hypothetical protein
MIVQGSPAGIARGKRREVGNGGVGEGGGVGVGSVGATAMVAERGEPVPPRLTPTSPSPFASVSRIAFAVEQLRLNQQVTGSQRSLAFLDEAAQQLREFKGTLGSSLAGRSADRTEPEDGLRRFAAHWGERHAATGGTLSSDLAYRDDGSASQRFRIRGVDLDALLQSDNAETLSFYPGGAGRPPVSLSIEAGPHDAITLVRRLDRALAPAGMRAALDSGDMLVFSVPESDWPRLRDHLLIRGGGSRFPGGEPNKAVAEALPGVVEPQRWSVQDQAAQRSTLRRAVQALDQIATARTAVRDALDEASETIRSGAGLEAAAREAAPALGALLERRGDFQTFSAIGSALRRVSRQGVEALLRGA